MAEPKTQPTSERVEDFINRIEAEQIRKDCFQLVELMKRASGEEPVMWGESIVGFGTYTIRYANGREAGWPVIGFSPRKQNLAIYLTNSFVNRDELLKKLGKHSLAKACLYIKRLSDVDLNILEEMAQKSCEQRRRTHP